MNTTTTTTDQGVLLLGDDQWVAFDEITADGIELAVADERDNIPAEDASDGGVIRVRLTWSQVTELRDALDGLLHTKRGELVMDGAEAYELASTPLQDAPEGWRTVPGGAAQDPETGDWRYIAEGTDWAKARQAAE